ncbi:MAG: NAD(P)-binding protein [Sulfuritalea sp.]|nr:NAD(P)-binding protein [Sulfuritalea sp.]
MRYGVVGGGMLGLTLAMRLRAAGHAVTVVESAPELGGLASAWQVGEVTWDRYYHVIAGSDTTLCEMLAGLGLESAIVWRTTRTNFYDGKALRPLNDAFDYWRLPGLRLVDKARLAATILIAARISGGRRRGSASRQCRNRDQSRSRRPEHLQRRSVDPVRSGADDLCGAPRRPALCRPRHRRATSHAATPLSGHRMCLDAADSSTGRRLHDLHY